MSTPDSLTVEDLRLVAQIVIAVLAGHGYNCWVFSGSACNLWGATRTPNDVDIRFMPNTESENAETVKELIVRKDSRFYLESPSDPSAPYRVLYARLVGRRACKVDIMVPTLFSIPAKDVQMIDGIRVMPLLPLLLAKLKGWTDHREATNERMNHKQHNDAHDLVHLFIAAEVMGMHIRDLKWPEAMLPGSLGRAAEFADEYPRIIYEGKAIGLLEGDQ